MGGNQEGDGQEGLGKSIQALKVIFYADDRIFALPESALLHGAFDTLTGLFDRVGLHTNKVNMVIMACQPCHTPHTWSNEAYTWRVTGRGLFYRERL